LDNGGWENKIAGLEQHVYIDFSVHLFSPDISGFEDFSRELHWERKNACNDKLAMHICVKAIITREQDPQ